MRYTIVAVFVVLLACCAYAQENAPVVKVIDGDTIKVQLAGRQENVRLIGIDTPETVHPTQPDGCFGSQASARLKELISQRNVTLLTDSVSGDRDKYDRLLRYVYLGSADINGQMIKDGYAFAYTRFAFLKSDEYVGYQINAQELNAGLWNESICPEYRERRITNKSHDNFFTATLIIAAAIAIALLAAGRLGNAFKTI